MSRLKKPPAPALIDPYVVAALPGFCAGWRVVRQSEMATTHGIQFAGMGADVRRAAKKFAETLNLKLNN